MNRTVSVSSKLIPATGRPQRRVWSWQNRRTRALVMMALCVVLLGGVLLAGYWTGEEGLKTRLSNRNQPPSWAYPFGTDWLGRDMLTRTLMGLGLSLKVGLAAASVSAVLGMILGLAAAAFGRHVDAAITWAVDLFMSVPHLVLLILLSFVAGGGLQGVVIAIAVTHWPRLTRVIRAEALQIKGTDYVQLSAKFGRSRWWIARHHIMPHLVPQFLVGLILLFPHAILHEAGLTFIGIGLSPHTPAIGVILSESMRHLSTGYWWLAVIPGVALLVTVKAFDVLGEQVRDLLNPRVSQE